MYDQLLANLAILVLAGFVGFAVISKVPNTLHTPLMSGTNAIHGIVVLGALIVLGDLPADASWGVRIIAFVALVFVPIGYIYPSRTSRWQGPTVVLGALWGLEMAVIIWQLPEPSRWLVRISFVYPVYYFAVSLLLHRARPKAAPSAVQ